MSQWDDHQMGERVRTVLQAVHLNNPGGHHFGRPFISAYQIAIAADEADPNLKFLLGKQVGGAGTGGHTSLAQYIANELSKQIKARGADHYAEGAFMSNERVRSITYRGASGDEILSSLAGTDFDMALFRLRSQPDG